MTGSEWPGDGGRREELIAAALAGELSTAESAEFDRLRSTDPTIDDELVSFGAVLSDVRGVGRWDESAPTPELRERISAIAGVAAPVALTAVPSSGRSPRGRRLVLGLTAAAACVALGAVGGLALQALGDRPVQGGPGTLGAVETIAFAEDSAFEIDGSLIAHTWGTETILRASGFTVGESYDLVLVTESGERLPSGSFLGSAVEIDCEMNAAVLRASVASIEIVDETGGAVAIADLPAVES